MIKGKKGYPKIDAGDIPNDRTMIVADFYHPILSEPLKFGAEISRVTIDYIV